MGIAAVGISFQHCERDRDHDEAEQSEQALAIHGLAGCGANCRSNNPGRCEDSRASPFDGSEPGMHGKAESRVQSDSDGGRADRDMRRWDSDQIDEQGTARIDPPPPTRPSVKPIMPPEPTARAARSAVIAMSAPCCCAQADAAVSCRFQGIRANSFAMPHQPVAPANIKPAPTNAERPIKPGVTSTLSRTPSNTKLPAVNCT